MHTARRVPSTPPAVLSRGMPLAGVPPHLDLAGVPPLPPCGQTNKLKLLHSPILRMRAVNIMTFLNVLLCQFASDNESLKSGPLM